jgi:hypothetical protein
VDGLAACLSGPPSPGCNTLERSLLPLAGERFKTLARPADQPPHIVVRAAVWDVHVIGSVTPDMVLSVARSLVASM